MPQRTNTTHRHDCSFISSYSLGLKSYFTTDGSIFVIRMWRKRILKTDKWRCLIIFYFIITEGTFSWGIKLWRLNLLPYPLTRRRTLIIRLSFIIRAKCTNQNLFSFYRWKNCMNLLIVYWMFSFHCTVLWYLSLDLAEMFIDHVLPVHWLHPMFFCLWNSNSHK